MTERKLKLQLNRFFSSTANSKWCENETKPKWVKWVEKGKKWRKKERKKEKWCACKSFVDCTSMCNTQLFWVGASWRLKHFFSTIQSIFFSTPCIELTVCTYKISPGYYIVIMYCVMYFSVFLFFLEVVSGVNWNNKHNY